MSKSTRRPRVTRATLRIDDRFQVAIHRNAPPPMACAQLAIFVHPITDGRVWDDPYQVFVVDEGRIVELENQRKEK